MNALLSLAFALFNGYQAVRSFRTKQWGWFALCAALTAWCTYTFLLSIR